MNKSTKAEFTKEEKQKKEWSKVLRIARESSCNRYGDANNLLKRLLNTFTCDARRGYWTLRLSINLEHLGYTEESLQIVENGLLDSWVRVGSRLVIQRQVLRLGKTFKALESS